LEFAETTKSDAAYSPVADNFYKSFSSFWDEFSWAAAWIYLASGEQSYIEKAESYVSKWETEMANPQLNINGLIAGMMYYWCFSFAC
jgi:hypothetical protein